MVRTALVIAGLAAVAGTAAAGPMPGGYKVESLGVAYGPGSLPTGYLAFSPATMLLSFDEQKAIYPLNDPNFVSGNSDWIYLTGQFDLKLRITDTASGTSGVVDAFGTVEYDWIHRWDGEMIHDFGLLSADGTRGQAAVSLGGNLYAVQIGTTELDYRGGDTAPVSITVSPAAVQTPEPGTLALAVFGLLPVAGVTVRRRA